MADSNTTLASLWVDDGQASPMKDLSESSSRSSNNGGTQVPVKDDIIMFYKETGLETVAREVGIIDSRGGLAGFKDQNKTTAIQYVAVPLAQSPAKGSPFKIEQTQIYQKAGNQVYSTQQVSPHSFTSSPRTHVFPVDSHWGGRNKRQSDLAFEADFPDSKRGKKGEKGGKGLRHFSMKVCEKVQRKGITSYNEVADELVAEFSDPRNNMVSPADQISYDQKNIRRRVYDALNVLMAMNIISKEKKEIRWIGLPTNSAQECQNLEVEKQRRVERIKHKTQQLQELMLQQIAFKNLVQRNRELEKTDGNPAPNSSIQLPFIIVNTSKKTVIDCSISNDKYEYLFNFDNTFEIHDDIEVLKRMGMAFGLEKGHCTGHDLTKAVKMVPKALEPYVLDLAQSSSLSSSVSAGPSGITSGFSTGLTSGSTPQSRYKPIRPHSPLATPLAGHGSSSNDNIDMEVALATGLSRESSLGSGSDMHSRTATETPSEMYSDGSGSERSSPVEMV